VNRVVLVRRGEGVMEAREQTDEGTPVEVTQLPTGQLAGFVRERESSPVRWVWDDTTRWYPALLAAGVRVERCTDLRLGHALLRRSPFADPALLTGGDGPGWEALQQVTETAPALFALDDPADRLDPVAEHERQQAVLAASPQRARLGLLVAAEASGALAAAR
jgi:DNA polymerase I